MFARITTIDGSPKRLDDAVDFVRNEVAPALAGLEGSRGLGMFLDRESGRVVVTSAWTTAATRASSAPKIANLRAKALEILQAEQASIEDFELAVIDRPRPAQPGYWQRTTRFSCAPADIDLAVDAFRTNALPALELLDGFCSAVLLVDTTRGLGLGSVVFDSHDALSASRSASQSVRSSTLAKAHGEIVEVIELEIAIAGLQPPD